MIAELGHFSLTLTLGLAVLLGVVPLVGAWRNNSAMMALARPLSLAMFGFVSFAFAVLMLSFANNDFSIELVAQHSNSELPLQYRVAATWGSHEGSMLLWVMMLAGWTGAVALFSGNLAASLRARVLAVMGLIQIGFLLFLLFTSNPFGRMFPMPADGRDLNPLLQDPGMVFHPPLLYMGYVGFAVAFAFAVAGLLEGRFDAAWARWARPWTTVAWAFLTLGIALGSFWAYYELGWGGWWFWDPVENASFMPWLVGTALIHSLAVTEKRGAFRSWTVLLAIMAFSLSLLGTFLVRSGVLTSVHAFATDPTRGVFILGFLGIVIGGSLALFAWRAPKIGLGPSFGLISRESALLANNVVLVAAMGAVLLGTLYPLVLDTLDLGKISVGPPYFDAVFYPLTAPAMFLIAVGPLARWKQAEVPDLARRLRMALIIAVVVALLVPLIAMGLGMDNQAFRPKTSLGMLFALWIVAGVVTSVVESLRVPPGGANAGSIKLERMRLHPASHWGMHLAHLGLAIFVIGVTLVKSYETEVEQRIEVGQQVAVGAYTARFVSLDQVKGPNYDGVQGHFELSRSGQIVDILHPQKRIYRAGKQPMTEAAIDRSPWRDVYISMGEPVGEKAWAVRLHVKPFVNWIWAGCVFMALGGFVAIADKRYRRRAAAAAPARAMQSA
jgi:cytochrome c-type biogenesis protein CcmF